ncbi:hypothetical protein [Actinopolymorpha pittospori]|uniref:Uncharacterized protein n=1 Tax=Actinopolymorpha pittospori TaxID=648752 RepID=A0A927MTG1_9ACTN|nr:hypothetical protein [Actinopolymorpha pittospori]MBE1605864.1 hypothetical protein [Actinopolymorpha pittospori]
MTVQRGRVMRKLREWFVRYAPAEIAGTATALAGYWVAYWITEHLAVAAVAAVLCENIGYYSIAVGREVVRYWRLHAHHATARRLWLTGVHGLRDALMEFGPAEALDSFVVRPGLFYLLPLMFTDHHAVAVIVAKFGADAVFYLLAITAYELNKRVLSKRLATVEVQATVGPLVGPGSGHQAQADEHTR